MTEIQFSFLVAQVHPITLAITEILAIGTFTRSHPFPVPIRMELVFPHLHEIVLVNVSLMIVATNAGALRDGTVYQNRPHRNACLTSKETVANLSFVVTQEAFASIVQTDASLLSGGTDKLHHPTEIVVGQL